MSLRIQIGRNVEVAPSDAAVYFAGDIDGNGKDDLIGFYQAEEKVYILLTP